MEALKTGKLKIGDNWNAITIIALSQNNPLKAIAEFIENSIDANAKNITIIRGKHNKSLFLKIIDDGHGIDDFKYVATHIGDSIKRKLKKTGISGIQGEFGIGLLSFWTVGEELHMTSTGKDKVTRKLKLVKGNPGYSIEEINNLIPKQGTELAIFPLLQGIKQITGEKIQNYLASELRDRISKNNINIKIIDRQNRKELLVEPRKFTGRLLHELPAIKSPLGEIYAELYVSTCSPENKVGVYKLGTRVLDSITRIEDFNCHPWTSGYLEGIIDVSFLQLTPGTRDGIIYDDAFQSFTVSMEQLNEVLSVIVDDIKNASEQEASKKILLTVKKALKEAYLRLPREQYDWLEVVTAAKRKGEKQSGQDNGTGVVENIEYTEEGMSPIITDEVEEKSTQKEFFEFPGPLNKVVMSPANTILNVNKSKKFRIIARDKSNRLIDSMLEINWEIFEGEGSLSTSSGEMVQFTATGEPGISMIRAIVKQDDIELTAEGIITITEELINGNDEEGGTNAADRKKGLPGYTYQKSPGELWRSRFDIERNIIIINNSHADFVFASKSRIRKLKYITKIYAKELVIYNFPGASKEELLERMIELTLYTEENLR